MIKLLDTIGLCLEHPAFAMAVRCLLAFIPAFLTNEIIKAKSNEPLIDIPSFHWILILMTGFYQVLVVVNANMSGSWARYFEAKRNGKTPPTPEPLVSISAPPGAVPPKP